MAAFDSRAFFTLYGELSLSDRPEQLSELYADAFVAAGPEGSGAFTNDGAFQQWLREVRAGNIQAGMTELTVADVKDHHPGGSYVLCTVTWAAKFEKTGDEAITFDISYMLDIATERPKILGYFSHQSEQAAKEKRGLA